MFSSFVNELNSLLEFIGNKLTELQQSRLACFSQINVSANDSFTINNCAKIVSVMFVGEWYGMETTNVTGGVASWTISGTTAELAVDSIPTDPTFTRINLYVVYERA